MSITSELRNYITTCNQLHVKRKEKLERIADRIDKQYEQEITEVNARVERWHKHKCDDCECIELPKDKNGNTIHVGYFVNCFEILIGGAKSETRWSGIVTSCSFLGNGKWQIHVDSEDVTNEDGDFISEVYPPGNCEIIEPDTQENIDADIYVDECKYFGGNDGNSCEQCRNYENKGDDCLRDMIEDLLRRQRELDGVK